MASVGRGSARSSSDQYEQGKKEKNVYLMSWHSYEIVIEATYALAEY